MKRNQDCNRNPLKRKMATYCTIAMFVTLTGIAITICVPMIVSFILDKVMNIFNLYISGLGNITIVYGSDIDILTFMLLILSINLLFGTSSLQDMLVKKSQLFFQI